MSALDGVRVLELTQIMAGPFCGQVLADMGMRVEEALPPRIAEASAIGPIDHVKERIGLYRDAGATHLFFDRRGIPANRYEFHSLIEMLRSA